jgi:hypothetical protein
MLKYLTNWSETRTGTDLPLMYAAAVRCCQDSLPAVSIVTFSAMRFTWRIIVSSSLAPALLGQQSAFELDCCAARYYY